METKLRRGLFGYSKNSVTEVVNEREVSIIKASREAKEAREEADTLAADLDKSRIEIADLQGRNRDLELKLEDAAERFRAVERSGSTSTTEGLTDVLHAAERALARLTDGARKNAEKQLGETERVRDSLRQEIDRLAAWQARMAPLAESIPDSIEDVRKEASAITDRLREALRPASDALDTLAARLSDLADTPEPPGPNPEGARDVIALGEAADGASHEMSDENLGVFAWPPDPTAR
jgi:uncharacterized phage infection (PIP) family protein YhgE